MALAPVLQTVGSAAMMADTVCFSYLLFHPPTANRLNEGDEGLICVEVPGYTYDQCCTNLECSTQVVTSGAERTEGYVLCLIGPIMLLIVMAM